MFPNANELFLHSNLGLVENADTRDVSEEKFFYFIELSNGMHKTTWAGRLDVVDQTLIAAFQRLGVVPKTEC